MTARLGFGDDRMQRMEQATLWLQRMHSADEDERVVEAWLDWCQQDPLNQQAFDEIAAIWEMSGQLDSESSKVSGKVASSAPDMQRRRLVASFAGVAVAAAAGGWWLMRSPGNAMVTTEFSAPVGVNRTEKLADGSLLELGGGTRVSVTIGSRQRRVELHEGELFVTVHHEPQRPFSVDTGKLEVIATGTQFNVLRTTERTTVTVAEGSVAAFHEGQAAEGPNVSLQSGQQLVYSHATHNVAVRETDPRNAIAWRSGTLFFQNEPLSEVIATINRYTTRRIEIADSKVAALSFTGTARTDRVESWLQALPHVFSVAVTEQADGRRLIGPGPQTHTD